MGLVAIDLASETARDIEAPVAADVAEEEAAHEDRSRYGQMAVVFLCGMFAFLDLYCTQPLLPLLARVFHASEMRVGLTISASTVGVAVTAALLAIFGERLDRKRTIVRAMGLLGVCTLLTATASSLNMLALWRLLQGLLTPGVFIRAIAYVTEEWPALQVPRAMSVYMAGTVFGGFLGRSFGGLIAAHEGWRFVFLVLGAAILVGAVLIRRLLPPSQARTGIGQGVSTFPDAKLSGARPSPFLVNLRNPRLLATMGIGFCLLFTLVSVFSFITFYLAAPPFNLSTVALSWLFSVYIVGLAATLAAGPRLARLGLRRGMLGSLALCIAGAGLTLVHSVVPIAVGLAMVSSGIFIAQTCAGSFLRDAAPLGSRVSAAGMYICSYYIGGTVGGELPGVIWRLAGWPGCVALVCGFLLIAGLLASVFWPSYSLVPEPIPL
jgi:YNFM family putative membrane transporter